MRRVSRTPVAGLGAATFAAALHGLGGCGGSTVDVTEASVDDRIEAGPGANEGGSGGSPSSTTDGGNTIDTGCRVDLAFACGSPSVPPYDCPIDAGLPASTGCFPVLRMIDYELYCCGGPTGDTDGGIGADCTGKPCAKGLACCPSNNLCVLDNKFCSSPDLVACTRASDCPSGEVCCVLQDSTAGSGPTGSACKTACTSTGSAPDRGPACNVLDADGGVVDCPGPASQWFACEAQSSTPASLGVCVARSDF